jgi:hypothetical protein
MKRVINFSGGKTSALMTILLKPTEEDIVLFTDTGWEHPLTYKFIDDFEKNEGIKVHKVSYEHIKTPGLTGFDALAGWKNYLPNRMQRVCTNELKIKTAKRYLRSIGVRQFENFIGFRFDERERIVKRKQMFKNVFDKFPLNDLKVTKEMVNQYWLSKRYTLEIPSILGNCDLCFIKGKVNIIKILGLYPELADKWINAEESASKRRGSKTSFFKDITYRELLNIANSQKTLFDLELAEPAYNCSCTN